LRKIVAIAFAFLALMGCNDDNPKPAISLLKSDILIANQGNFGWGEGTLSTYNPNTKTVQNDVFKTINNQSLGNVFQSIAKINELYYFVINNSGKIIITDSTFSRIGEIDELISPRYIYPVTETKAYITDLYADAISVVDLTINEVIKSIPVNGWSEKGVKKGSIFWFVASESNKIYGVDIRTDDIVDSLDVGNSPESIISDNSNRIWVLCRGNEDLKPVLMRIDATNEFVEYQIELDKTPTCLVFDSSNDVIYYISGGIWSLNTNDMIPNLVHEGHNKTFYCLDVDPQNGDLYSSDAVDFVSSSSILRFDKQGNLIDQFYAGIITGDFFFQ
jgi:YVTN family beta-propeller protein